MEKGVSKYVSQVLRWMDPELQDGFYSFCSEAARREYTEYTNLDMALMCIGKPNYGDEVDAFVEYSGVNFRHINSAMRDRWNYEDNGHIDRKERFREVGSRMSSAIDQNQASIGNTKVFRGVTLDYFRDYGIESMDELELMKGNFLCDKGFVSTSLTRDASFYKRETDLGLDYRVGIEYLVPEEFGDGICISNVAYDQDQGEYLINTANMAKVVDVRRDGDGVILTAVLVPKKVYDKYYQIQAGSVK